MYGEDACNRSCSRNTEKEDVSVAFGVPGAAINPLYAAMKNQRVDSVFSPR